MHWFLIIIIIVVFCFAPTNGMPYFILVSLSTGGQDYDPILHLPLFTTSNNNGSFQCTNISIFNDSILEDTEEFQVLLTSSDPAVRIVRNVSTVYIIDDDGVRISLTMREVTVLESNELPDVCVELEGLIQRSISVALKTEPGSAESKLKKYIYCWS